MKFKIIINFSFNNEKNNNTESKEEKNKNKNNRLNFTRKSSDELLEIARKKMKK